MKDALPLLIALLVALSPVPLVALCWREVALRNRTLEWNFRQRAVDCGVRLKGHPSAWVGELMCRGHKIVTEPWSYSVASPEGGESILRATRARLVSSSALPNMALFRTDVVHSPPLGTVETGVSPRWQSFRAFAADPKRISAWLGIAPGPGLLGMPGVRVLECVDGFIYLVHEGDIADPADLARLGDLLVAFASCTEPELKGLPTVALHETTLRPFVGAFVALMILPVCVAFVTWPGIIPFFEPMFCPDGHELQTRWVSGDEPGSSNYEMECSAGDSSHSTSTLGSGLYHAMFLGLIVSAVLVAFLLHWRRNLRATPFSSVREPQRGRNAALTPYR